MNYLIKIKLITEQFHILKVEKILPVWSGEIITRELWSY